MHMAQSIHNSFRTTRLVFIRVLTDLRRVLPGIGQLIEARSAYVQTFTY